MSRWVVILDIEVRDDAMVDYVPADPKEWNAGDLTAAIRMYPGTPVATIEEVVGLKRYEDAWLLSDLPEIARRLPT